MDPRIVGSSNFLFYGVVDLKLLLQIQIRLFRVSDLGPDLTFKKVSLIIYSSSRTMIFRNFNGILKHTFQRILKISTGILQLQKLIFFQ
jgi:hypothetical protein